MPGRFDQSLGPANTLTRERSSETGAFLDSMKHIFRSQELPKYFSDEADPFFQNVQHFMQISKMK